MPFYGIVFRGVACVTSKTWFCYCS